jgi:molecular chaperone HscB
MADCNNCNEVLASPLACGGCESIFVASSELSPFEVFGLPVASRVERSSLRKKLLKLQRLLHPDFHGRAGEAMVGIAEHNTAEVNAAFEVLRDAARRASWIVEHLGGPSESTERQMPQAFLMEVMEWNETLEELKESGDQTQVKNAIDELKAELNMQRAELIENTLDDTEAHLHQTDGARPLAEIRRDLNAVRYIDRALREIASIELNQAQTN